MFYPSKEEFIKLSKKGNLIPVYTEIISDVETPVSAYKKIEDKYSFLLESVVGGEKIARYSFIGYSSTLIKGSDNPFKALKSLLNKYRPVKIPGLPRFQGGLVGYISYDAVKYLEKIPSKNPDDLKLPLYNFLFADSLLAFDHIKHKIIVISNAHVKGDPSGAYFDATKKIAKLVKKLQKPLMIKNMDRTNKASYNVSSNITKNKFENAVISAKEYIKAGDIIQVVLSQRFDTKFNGDAFNIYRVLRTINPSPYMYYLNFGSTKLIGSSPEVLVRLEDGIATLRPIAGTRKRGKSKEEDDYLEKNLLADNKEKAEHIMLVDLGRNDLGRVCQKGSVKVTELMKVEKYSHVMHIVSNVEGKLRKGADAIDLLQATFPAGTVSGAPKIRAMEIIDKLETAARGPYAGAVGYFGFSGELDSCITIRTIVLNKGKAFVQAGAGIVADSIPSKEYEESFNKAAALLKALETA